MRATSKVFYSIATYLLVSLIVYIFGVTFVKDDGYLYGAEWVGIVGMFLAFLLCMMLGAYPVSYTHLTLPTIYSV